MLNILSIGGSDPSSGAGIQSDVRACEFLHAYCLTAVTGVTSQNTTKFGTVEPVSAKILREQIEMTFSDFRIDAVKIGMVYSPRIIRVISDSLNGRNIPTVLDPVVKSTTGGMLITKRAAQDLARHIMPISTIITPNGFEAEFFTGIKIRTKGSAEKAAKRLQGMGAKNVAITGLNLKQGSVTDHILEGDSQHYLDQKRIPGINHGSGCNYSLAFCHALAEKRQIVDAALFSMQFAYDSIRNSKKTGRGIRITHQGTGDPIYDDLLDGIGKLRKMRGIHMHIPECQTNFVFSKSRPSSADDVLGVDGRIVKSGTGVIMAGSLKYGASRHVASAVLAASKKFPLLRAAINIRFQKDTIANMKRSQMVVLSYDRASEPEKLKYMEGSSVKWGTSAAIQNSERPPDAIFHEGDFGKEPMIIIFGGTPSGVIRKLRKALAPR